MERREAAPVLVARVPEQTRSRGKADWFIGELASPVTKMLGVYESFGRGGSSCLTAPGSEADGPNKRHEGEAQSQREAKR